MTCKECYHNEVCEALYELNGVPRIFACQCAYFRSTADVVEVVKCKDCKHRYVPCRCALYYGSIGDKDFFGEMGENFYCSYAERKENGT